MVERTTLLLVHLFFGIIFVSAIRCVTCGTYYNYSAVHSHARRHFEGHNAPKQSLIALYSKIAKQFVALFIFKKKILQYAERSEKCTKCQP